ncbi:unnamed protein product [Scytosiphon promiscuus]
MRGSVDAKSPERGVGMRRRRHQQEEETRQAGAAAAEASCEDGFGEGINRSNNRSNPEESRLLRRRSGPAGQGEGAPLDSRSSEGGFRRRESSGRRTALVFVAQAVLSFVGMVVLPTRLAYEVLVQPRIFDRGDTGPADPSLSLKVVELAVGGAARDGRELGMGSHQRRLSDSQEAGTFSPGGSRASVAWGAGSRGRFLQAADEDSFTYTARTQFHLCTAAGSELTEDALRAGIVDVFGIDSAQTEEPTGYVTESQTIEFCGEDDSGEWSIAIGNDPTGSESAASISADQMELVRSADFTTDLASSINGNADLPASVAPNDLSYNSLGYIILYDEDQTAATAGAGGLSDDFVPFTGPDQYWPWWAWILFPLLLLTIVPLACCIYHFRPGYSGPPSPSGAGGGPGMFGQGAAGLGKGGKGGGKSGSDADWDMKQFEKGAGGGYGDKDEGAFNDAATGISTDSPTEYVNPGTAYADDAPGGVMVTDGRSSGQVASGEWPEALESGIGVAGADYTSQGGNGGTTPSHHEDMAVPSEADRAAGVDPGRQHEQDAPSAYSMNPLVTSASFNPTPADARSRSVAASAGSGSVRGPGVGSSAGSFGGEGSFGSSFHDSAAGASSDASWAPKPGARTPPAGSAGARCRTAQTGLSARAEGHHRRGAAGAYGRRGRRARGLPAARFVVQGAAPARPRARHHGGGAGAPPAGRPRGGGEPRPDRLRVGRSRPAAPDVDDDVDAPAGAAAAADPSAAREGGEEADPAPPSAASVMGKFAAPDEEEDAAADAEGGSPRVGAEYVPVTGEGVVVGAEGVGPAAVPPASEGDKAGAPSQEEARAEQPLPPPSGEGRARGGAAAAAPSALRAGSLSPEEARAYSENVDRTLEDLPGEEEGGVSMPMSELLARAELEVTAEDPAASSNPAIPPPGADTSAVGGGTSSGVPPSAAPPAAPTNRSAGLPPPGPGQAAALARQQQPSAGSLHAPSLDIARLLHTAEESGMTLEELEGSLASPIVATPPALLRPGVGAAARGGGTARGRNLLHRSSASGSFVSSRSTSITEDMMSNNLTEDDMSSDAHTTDVSRTSSYVATGSSFEESLAHLSSLAERLARAEETVGREHESGLLYRQGPEGVAAAVAGEELPLPPGAAASIGASAAGGGQVESLADILARADDGPGNLKDEFRLLDDMEAKRLEDLNAAASAEGADDETKARWRGSLAELMLKVDRSGNLRDVLDIHSESESASASDGKSGSSGASVSDGNYGGASESDSASGSASRWNQSSGGAPPPPRPE